MIACSLMCVCMYVCVTHTYIFLNYSLNHMRVLCTLEIVFFLTPKYLSLHFLRTRISSHKSTVQLWKLGNLTLIKCCYLIHSSTRLISCFNCFLYCFIPLLPRSSPWSYIIFSVPVSLNLQEFLGLSFSFLILTFWMSSGHMFYIKSQFEIVSSLDSGSAF